jgi:hypothetical protein
VNLESIGALYQLAATWKAPTDNRRCSFAIFSSKERRQCRSPRALRLENLDFAKRLCDRVPLNGARREAVFTLG